MIRVDDIYFTYPSGTEALKGITTEIREEEFIAIIGENGAGKSTLVKHFNGLLKPSKGEVFVNDVNTRQLSVAQLARNVGIVFQNPDHQLFCETVEEEVAFGLKNFGFDASTIDNRIENTLEFLNLTQYRKSSPFLLSGGERKRVALATVLAWDPEIVVLDEPTIGQDYAQKEKLRQYILQLNNRGRTVIMVTHDVEFVADCAPRVIAMSNGRIVADGPAEKILTDSKTLHQTSIISPQIVQIMHALSDLGLQPETLDLVAAKEILQNIIERSMQGEKNIESF
jgi:energy-coupling factor transport system ATP-binding protein